MVFEDRQEAGRRLGTALRSLHGEDVVVLALPRGGVPVAAEVAHALDAPLDVIVVRKIGVPYHEELAMGAIGEGGARVVNEEVVRSTGVSSAQFAAVEARERDELARRAQAFRGGRERVALAGRTAIIVDDGIATGSTAAVACQVARALGASRVIIAVPVGPPDTIEELRRVADEVVCLETPEPFYAVGQWYRDFSATTDDQVVQVLHAQAEPTGGEVEVDTGSERLSGTLVVPDAATGLVVFAHGSGSSRNSPRNLWVAAHLNRAGLATLLFDLLTPSEQRTRANVFDIDLLGNRLAGATRWVVRQPEVRGLPLGYFGASTGAAAALWAAAEPELAVRALVSRGGRPDLAAARIRDVTAPTLLIVGGHDATVLELNERAASYMTAECRIVVIPGATHLFEEPGTLQMAADFARDWFVANLTYDGVSTRSPAYR